MGKFHTTSRAFTRVILGEALKLCTTGSPSWEAWRYLRLYFARHLFPQPGSYSGSLSASQSLMPTTLWDSFSSLRSLNKNNITRGQSVFLRSSIRPGAQGMMSTVGDTHMTGK